MNTYSPVLFIDDDAAMRHAVTQWLTLAGFEVLVREAASVALGTLTRDFTGVLVTDLRMDGLSGRDLLLLAQELDPELPVIVITGHGDAETGADILRLGAFAYMEKPFAPESLLEAVQRASKTRRATLERRHLRGDAEKPSVSCDAADPVGEPSQGSDAGASLERSRAGRRA